MPRANARPRLLVVASLLGAAVLAGCGSSGADGGSERPTLRISAIPDQDPAELEAREGALAAYLSDALDVEVEYVPVTDYAASVSHFRAGDLDAVFYGGLTGAQARQQTPGAALLAQRDIDADFRSVFIANAEAGVEPVDDVAGLTALEGTRFTFGSESSTSGRLMPEYFLAEAGVDSAEDFAGRPGFSGSHDVTIDLVEAGSYEAGVLNVQVWEARQEAGTVDLDRVVEVFTTPTYSDYHWLGGPGLDERFGSGFTEDLRAALLDLDGSTAEEEQVLALYGAGGLVPVAEEDYEQVEEIGRRLGLLS
ncbi:putative selenate ABC transporter substrate-binding protein [Nocardioides marmotae]|uniref:putative selenate ABC transporter substrate-binding protein n=1 Tax=Nocardioides marmotae TaxID=2663857 RepID=UPI001320932F|nr:putative selenate ABC transporter substrate-binding protein [Nocardioides marmotae]MBC9733648.1 putative selenate ABC transporter substrate-binding protein [Nocardioides marmotae]MTB84751.1 putative selenate ABC transporter substrate-binding protein [Nocardioides marmotae]